MQKFKVQAKRSGIGHGHNGSTQMGILLSEKNKEIKRVLQVQTFLQHRITHGSERRKERDQVAWAGHYGLPTSSLSDPSQAPNVNNPWYVWTWQYLNCA